MLWPTTRWSTRFDKYKYDGLATDGSDDGGQYYMI